MNAGASVLHVVARKLTNDSNDDGDTDYHGASTDAIDKSTDPWIPIMKMLLDAGFDANAGSI